MQLNKTGKKYVIIYDEILTISHIRSQQSIYQEALKTAKSITLQITTISSIDTASIQLLLSFLLAAKQQKTTWQWHGYSPALHQAAQLLGLAQLLALPKQIAEVPR